MLQVDPNPDRESIGFKEAALSSFRFLSDLGFRTVAVHVTQVRYESHDVFVNVYHGRASFELGVEIGRLKHPDEKVPLDEMLTFADAKKAEGFDSHVMFQVSSGEGVKEFVPKLARLV